MKIFRKDFWFYEFPKLKEIKEKWKNIEKTSKPKNGKFARFSRKIVHVFQGKKKDGFTKNGNETRFVEVGL